MPTKKTTILKGIIKSISDFFYMANAVWIAPILSLYSLFIILTNMITAYFKANHKNENNSFDIELMGNRNSITSAVINRPSTSAPHWGKHATTSVKEYTENYAVPLGQNGSYDSIIQKQNIQGTHDPHAEDGHHMV